MEFKIKGKKIPLILSSLLEIVGFMLKQQGKSTNWNIPHGQKCGCLAACRTEDAWPLAEEAVGCERGGGRSAQGFPSLIFVLQSPSVKEGAWPGKNWSSWNPKAKIMLTSVGVGAGLQRMDKNSQIFLIRQLLPMYVVLISSHTWVIFAVIKKRLSFVTLNAVRLFRSLT